MNKNSSNNFKTIQIISFHHSKHHKNIEKRKKEKENKKKEKKLVQERERTERMCRSKCLTWTFEELW